MQDFFKLVIIFESGETVKLEDLNYGETYQYENEWISIDIGDTFPISVTVELLTDRMKIQSIEYYFITSIKNYSYVIIPESGRWFPNAMKMVTFWKSYRNLISDVGDIKLPLYIFSGRDKYMGMAVGVIGPNIETEFNLVEPESNRALNVHTGNITLQFKRGTYSYPLTNRITKGVSYKEYIYYNNVKKSPKQPWMLTMREFTTYQRALYKLEDQYVRDSLQPIWCTWADWHSNDLNEKMILENVTYGLELGIKNYIIDDGWFGPGLDSDYSVPLNIGNWTPDPNKISDIKLLVSNIKSKGANAIIWCAPHALAEMSDRYEERRKYVISDGNQDILCTPKFYSLCFMCPEAREIMADICESFVVDWDFDGAKYDLFNWVSAVRCENPNHHHDVDSMIEGLDKTLELIDIRTRKHKKEYIVELKQNYGTPFLSRWGTMMRAGDAPFDPEMNLLRTLHIQSYTPFALNDYQTFTKDDTPEDVAVAILKMIAVGIPSYSVDFKKLNKEQLFIINKLNQWYIRILDDCISDRESIDAENHVMKLSCKQYDLFFILNNSEPIIVKRDTIIYNASYVNYIHLFNTRCTDMCYTIEDCFGKSFSQSREKQELITLSIPAGGCVKIGFEHQ